MCGKQRRASAKEEAITENKKSMWLQAASLSYLGIFFGVSVVIGAALGGFLDRRWGTKPYLLMVGVLLGIATGFNELWRVAKRYQNQLKKKP